MRVICKLSPDRVYSFAHSSGVKLQIVPGKVYDLDELGVDDKEFWTAVGNDVVELVEDATAEPGRKRTVKRP